MASNAQRAPKQWQLTKNETITSYEGWKQNLVYTLSLDNNFSTFLADGFCWEKKSTSCPYRGITDDCTDVAASQRRIKIRRALSKARLIQDIGLPSHADSEPEISDSPDDTSANLLLDNTYSARLVHVIQSPYLDVYHQQHLV